MGVTASGGPAAAGLRRRRRRFGFGCASPPSARRAAVPRAVLLALGLARLLLPLPPPRLARGRLRRRQVVGERVRDLGDLPELLAGAVEGVVRPRRVALGRGEECRTHFERERLRDLDQLAHVVLVPVAARVGDGAEQPLRLRELRAGTTVLHLPRRLGQLPRPPLQDLIRGVCLAVADRAEEDADAGGAVLLPGRRLTDQGDEIVEVGALDGHRDAVLQRGHAQAAVGILRRADREEGLERELGRAALGELPREVGPLVEAQLPSGDRRPVALLVVVEELRVDSLPLALDHSEPARDVGGHRDEPRRRREMATSSALHPAARRRRDACALAVEVGVEQRVERDDPLVVRGRLRREVDDDPRLLAWVRPHDPADSLLVHALRRRRCEVHADGRARRVPALGEQHGVDQHVDLAALVGRERLRELDGRCAAGDRLRLQPGGTELLREVVGVVDTGCIDDPGRGVEPLAVQARGGLVQGLVVEGRGERALLEVAADDRNGVDRRSGRDAEAAKRRDESAAGGVREGEVVDGGREDIGDLLRDQLLRRGHADVDRLREAADRRARLLAECRVRLVADHELVRVAGERVGVAGEPGVGLDRERVARERLLSLLDRRREAVAVALGGEVAVELGDEQAAVGEDQDAERARGLDEAGGRDRLARCGRMAEAVAALGARVVAVEALGLVAVLLAVQLVLVLERFLGFRVRLGVTVAVLLLLELALVRRDQLRQHPRERVDLVLAQLGAGGGGGRLRREHPLEPEQEAEPDFPAGGRGSAAGRELDQCLVERGAAGGPRGQCDGRVFARVKEGLAGPFLCS